MKIWTLAVHAAVVQSSRSLGVNFWYPIDGTDMLWFKLCCDASLCDGKKRYEMPDFITISVMNEYLIIGSDATKPAFHFLSHLQLWRIITAACYKQFSNNMWH